MNGNKAVELLTELLGKKPNLDKSFIQEGGDSFSALLLTERLAEEGNIQVEIDRLLSHEPLRGVLGLS